MGEPHVQRACSCSGGCPKCQGEKTNGIQAKQDGAVSASPLLQLRSEQRLAGVLNHAVRSPGQALDPATRGYFEPLFGHDFSQVRVHSGSNAAESARSLSARAFTAGRNIVFAEGRYRPGTPDGKRLLAHELAHVVQQSRGGPVPTSGHQAGRLESDADRAADMAASGAPAADVAGTAPGGVQMNAEVYVWNPHVDGFGHAAFKLCDGTYISWWPVAPAADKKEQYWSGRKGGPNTYADDIGPGGEGKAQDVTYDLGCNCLDESAIKSWYVANFSGNPDAKWAVLKNSCSDVAHQAINEGSGTFNPCYLSISHSNFFWTPKDLGAYADCQSRWCASKAAGPLNAAGRYAWENVKEIAGGWAWNTLKSLWWKGEIIVH
jgi:hypothetical protein